jgi:hypothetical protein
VAASALTLKVVFSALNFLFKALSLSFSALKLPFSSLKTFSSALLFPFSALKTIFKALILSSSALKLPFSALNLPFSALKTLFSALKTFFKVSKTTFNASKMVFDVRKLAKKPIKPRFEAGNAPRRTRTGVRPAYNGHGQSGRGLPHSWTLRVHDGSRTARSVPECAGPPALYARHSASTSNSSPAAILSVLNR